MACVGGKLSVEWQETENKIKFAFGIVSERNCVW